ncbi:MAG TPA: alpha/beta fold hydrolase, partial [Ktedonobacteraceae bacterium]|nr:alpha/beta fold hydrolase [Ktedonobacteraceae bacterium]
ALAATGRYTIYAPDMRGYGASETLPVDGTRGVRDYSDDLASLVQKLELPAFHLLGWSLGGNIVIQYTLDYPQLVQSLTLQATGSPFGFGGTKDVEGTPTWPDFAGSGGGTINPDFAQRLGQGDRGSDPSSPRTVINTFYFKPPFRVSPEREEMLVSSVLTTQITPGNYDTDMVASSNWPMVAPGTRGVNNALSPKYLNQGELVDIPRKPPILWVHGADDQIVSDTSFFEFGYLGQIGAVPGWPGAEAYPAQPMKGQIRAVLARYQENGGMVQEVTFADCGHSPHLEKPEEMLQAFTDFIDASK